MATKKKKKVAPKKAHKSTKAAPKKKVAAKKKVALKKKHAAPKKGVAKRVAKKAAAKPARKAAKKPAKKKPIARRDGSGHMNAKYARELRARSGPSEKEDTRAFLKGSRSTDDLAEQLGEEVVGKANSGEDEAEDVADQFVDEEVGGPFVESTAGKEFGFDTDASNPKGADREPFPKV